LRAPLPLPTGIGGDAPQSISLARAVNVATPDDEGLNLILEHCARLNSFEPGHAESASSHRSVTGESGLQAR
jgi:hypothetical protein